MISVVLGFHLCVSRRSLQLTLALVCWCWLGCFLLVSVGELIFDLFLTSSNNLTATVDSNAATEKKNHRQHYGCFSSYRVSSTLMVQKLPSTLCSVPFSCCFLDIRRTDHMLVRGIECSDNSAYTVSASV